MIFCICIQFTNFDWLLLFFVGVGSTTETPHPTSVPQEDASNAASGPTVPTPVSAATTAGQSANTPTPLLPLPAGGASTRSYSVTASDIKPLSSAWQQALASATNNPPGMNTEKKRVVRRQGPKVVERPVRALYCLSLKNPLRKLCIDVVEWKYPFL